MIYYYGRGHLWDTLHEKNHTFPTGCPISSRTWVGLTQIFEVPQAGGLLMQLTTAQAGWWNISNMSQPNQGSRGDGTPCIEVI